MANAFVAAFEILSFGAIIVLIVLGLGIIASMMGIFNFAQGEFVLLGAYITYLAYAKGMPIWTGMVAAPFVVGALGFVLEALIIRRFYAAPIVAMLGTYALGLIIRESVRGLIGGFYLTVPEPIGGAHREPKAVCTLVGKSLTNQLFDLTDLSVEQLLVNRDHKYRKIGAVGGLPQA